MKNISNGFIIGIDSGGTKCELLIADNNKKIIYSKFFKGIHYSLEGKSNYSNYISECITSALREAKLNLNDCSSIGIGIAGAREKKDRADLRKEFGRNLNFKKILITTDAMTALYGAFGGDEGIILISGTGSVLYGYSDSKVIRVGGWGRIIGDEGSGYWIGKRALNLVMKEYDSAKTNKSLLSQRLFEIFRINNRNVNEKVFHKNFELQRIAPVVIRTAENKCSLSVQIVNEAVESLTNHIKTFLEVSGRTKKIKIAFIGSIIENKNLLSDKLKREIKKLKLIDVVLKKHTPAFGAALLAADNSELIKKL